MAIGFPKQMDFTCAQLRALETLRNGAQFRGLELKLETLVIAEY